MPKSRHSCSECHEPLTSWCVIALGGEECYGSTAVCPTCRNSTNCSSRINDDTGALVADGGQDNDDTDASTADGGPDNDDTDASTAGGGGDNDDTDEPVVGGEGHGGGDNDNTDEPVVGGEGHGAPTADGGGDDDNTDADDGDALDDTACAREIRLSFAAVSGDKDRTGIILVNGIEYQYKAEGLSNQFGRGPQTAIYQSNFTTTIPTLFGYKICAGIMTRAYAFISMCMTQSGDMLVCILETRCNKPRYDPVIFDAKSQTCSILKRYDWRKKLKLDIGAKLTVDIDVVKK